MSNRNDSGKRGAVRAWIEAMRLRTLPVGASCVLAGVGLALLDGYWRLWPAVICLVFALLAQVASNFANEYFDYRAGLDAPGREGPRRGVTEGDITPRAMAAATFATLGIDCLIGCSLIWWGGWWMLAAGAVIALFAIAYSAGPWPLSRHGLGSVAVMLFFGIVPVSLTYYLQSGVISGRAVVLGIAVGALACNILLVNNYRDRVDDAAVGKITDVGIVGARAARLIYVANGVLAVALTCRIWYEAGAWTLVFPAVYLGIMTALWRRLCTREGHALNPVLGMTAMSELFFTLALVIAGAVNFAQQ